MTSGRGLLIDCAGKELNLALTDVDGRPDVARSIPTRNDLTDMAVEQLARFLGDYGVRPEGVSRLYVSVGPGSFTGVRVACALAKAWALAHPECELHAISSLRLRVPQESADGVSVLDAAGGKVYCGVYRNNAGRVALLGRGDAESLLKAHPRVKAWGEKNRAHVLEWLRANLGNFVRVPDPRVLAPLYVKPATNG